ncbi:MAG: hypothetical protein LBD82_02835 [Deltaproteobacteria bacterium]|jgi:hypothetical protein|nr:hypothetical protein [Deltaproteobacteria bacterium]
MRRSGDYENTAPSAGQGRRKRAHRSILFAGLAFFLFCSTPAWNMGRVEVLHPVGVRSLTAFIQNKAQPGVMLWYPARRGPRFEPHAAFGRWMLRAERDAPPLEALLPVILISHDSAGHSLTQHELAAALAARGFAVIAPTHTGDSIENAGAMYTAALAWFRPVHLRDALAAALAEPVFTGILDAQRIGLLGVGAGALTVLQLCGVSLNPDAYAGYCAAGRTEAPENAYDPALCSSWAEERLGSFQTDMKKLGSMRRGRDNENEGVPWSGVKAAGLLAPGWLVMADSQRLAGLNLPVAALFAGHEELYPGPDKLMGYVPVRTAPEDTPKTPGETRRQKEKNPLLPLPFLEKLHYKVLEQADHYSLSASCPEDRHLGPPGMCGTLNGAEREQIIRERDAFFAAFFLSTLGGPLPKDQENNSLPQNP